MFYAALRPSQACKPATRRTFQNHESRFLLSNSLPSVVKASLPDGPYSEAEESLFSATTPLPTAPYHIYSLSLFYIFPEATYLKGPNL